MSLPKQVTDAGLKSDEAIKQFLQQQQDETAKTETPPADEKPTQQAPAPAPTPAVDTPPQEPDWKARYLTLNGKYVAEVPRLTKALTEANERAAQLEKRVAELEASKGAQTSTPSSVTDEDKDRFDPAVIELATRIAKEQTERAVGPMRETVEQARIESEQRRKEQLNSIAQGAFFEALSRLVPNWEEVNKTPAFHAYLAQVDDSGEQRQASLVKCQQTCDAVSAAAVFLDFQRAQPQQVQQPRKPQLPTVPELAGAGATPPPPPGAKVWTEQDVKRFYDDLAKGRYRHDPVGAARIEREIEQAALS